MIIMMMLMVSDSVWFQSNACRRPIVLMIQVYAGDYGDASYYQLHRLFTIERMSSCNRLEHAQRLSDMMIIRWYEA